FSRALAKTGYRMDASSVRIGMTTKSSMSVTPRRSGRARSGGCEKNKRNLRDGCDAAKSNHEAGRAARRSARQRKRRRRERNQRRQSTPPRGGHNEDGGRRQSGGHRHQQPR